MCLAIPGKVLELFEEDGLLMGKIDFSGCISKVCLVYCPKVEIGEYVIVHAGFAISVLDEAEANETLRCFGEILRSTDVSQDESKVN